MEAEILVGTRRKWVKRQTKTSRDWKDEQRIVSNIYERSALHRSASCFAMITSLPWGVEALPQVAGRSFGEFTELLKDLKLSESLKCQRFNENIVNETLVCSLSMAKIFNFPEKNGFLCVCLRKLSENCVQNASNWQRDDKQSNHWCKMTEYLWTKILKRLSEATLIRNADGQRRSHLNDLPLSEQWT